MVFLHFVWKLLPNMRKHHIAAMLLPLAVGFQNQFIHNLLIDIVIVGLTVFRPFQGVHRWDASFQLMLMLFVFNAYMLFKTSLALPFLYSSPLQVSLARVQGFSLIVTMHNSTALKTNGMTEDILFIVLFRPKHFWYPVIRYKKAHVYAHNFSASFFSSSETHQSYHCDGC